MDDETVLIFDKSLKSLDYDHANEFNLKRTEPIKKDLKKLVEKISKPPLALLVDENEEESLHLQGEGKFNYPIQHHQYMD